MTRDSGLPRPPRYPRTDTTFGYPPRPRRRRLSGRWILAAAGAAAIAAVLAAWGQT